MNAFNFRLVLMPGLDGTGELFESFRQELPEDLDVSVVRYRQDRPRSYEELRASVFEACEGVPAVVLFAESFSSPLAIEIAASGLNNLSGLILCAGFAAPPVDGVVGSVIRNIPESVLRLTPPEWAIRRYLVGLNRTGGTFTTGQADDCERPARDSSSPLECGPDVLRD